MHQCAMNRMRTCTLTVSVAFRSSSRHPHVHRLSLTPTCVAGRTRGHTTIIALLMALIRLCITASQIIHALAWLIQLVEREREAPVVRSSGSKRRRPSSWLPSDVALRDKYQPLLSTVHNDIRVDSRVVWDAVRSVPSSRPVLDTVRRLPIHRWIKKGADRMSQLPLPIVCMCS